MSQRIAASELAPLIGCSPQRARKLCAEFFNGRTRKWRGVILIAYKVRGIGGKAGDSYQVLVSSLPLDLQTALKASLNVDLRQVKETSSAALTYEFYRINFGQILQHKAHSKARGKGITAAAERSYLCPDGVTRKFTERTIRRKLAMLERGDLAALHGRHRSDKGKHRVIISMKFDNPARDCGLSAETVAEIRAKLETYIRSHIAKGASRKVTMANASFKLQDLARERGFEAPLEACAIAPRFIEAAAGHKLLAQYDRDRKAYEDSKPRIQRSATQYLPMDIIIGDVSPSDIIMTRPDGSLATARFIAWMDCANRRLFVSVVLCDKGNGIRNADVLQSYMDMVATWGMPRALYLDNGSEYNWADLIEGALKLNAQLRVEAAGLAEGELGRVVRANAYNAAAKGAIEGSFRILGSTFLSHQPGYIGGNRMMKKSANVGRPPVPFAGGIGELTARIQTAIAYYNALPQRGALRNRSPNQVYTEAVEAGWQMTAVAEDTLRVAFSEEKVCGISKGRIQIAGQYWICDELMAYRRSQVTVLVPKYQRWQRLPLKDEMGCIFGFAEPDQAFPYFDPNDAEMASNVHRLPVPPRAPVGATIGASDEGRRIIAGITEPNLERQQARARKNSQAIDRQLARFQRGEKP